MEGNPPANCLPTDIVGPFVEASYKRSHDFIIRLERNHCISCSGIAIEIITLASYFIHTIIRMHKKQDTGNVGLCLFGRNNFCSSRIVLQKSVIILNTFEKSWCRKKEKLSSISLGMV